MAAKRRTVPSNIAISLCACDALRKREAAKSLLAELKKSGCQFLDRACKQPDSQPETRIKSTGSILVPIHFQHRLLQRDLIAVSRGASIGSAGLGYLAKSRSVVVRQTVAEESANWDDLAAGQLALAEYLYRGLRPVYGWIDEVGENAVEREFASIKEMRFIFWANVFGPMFVKHFGKDFLSACPAARIDWLEDGGAVVVSAQTYSEWYANPPAQLAEYFGQKVAGVQLYRSAGVQLPGAIAFRKG